MNNINDNTCTTTSNYNNSEPKGVHPFLQRVRVCRHYLRTTQCSLGAGCNFLHINLDKGEADELEMQARKRISLQRTHNQAMQYYLVKLYTVHAVDSLPDYEALDEAIKVLMAGGATAVELTQKAEAMWAMKGQKRIPERAQSMQRQFSDRSPSTTSTPPMVRAASRAAGRPAPWAPTTTRTSPWEKSESKASESTEATQNSELYQDQPSRRHRGVSTPESFSDDLSSAEMLSDTHSAVDQWIDSELEDLPVVYSRAEAPAMTPIHSFYHPMESMMMPHPEMMHPHPDMMPYPIMQRMDSNVHMQRMDSYAVPPMQRMNAPMMQMPSFPMLGHHMHAYPMYPMHGYPAPQNGL